MATTQDPIEQVLGKLGEFGVPVGEIGDKAKGLIAQVGSMDPGAVVEQVGAIDLSQLDVGEMLGELKDRVDNLDPALRVPVMVAAGFVAARVVRWIIR
ncbi:MAG: hypothetical protein QOG15_2616 [Solirubrobacteraceae bacterium]|nr:hypothetical protein [Solirubrobacteraceae bacterium]